MHIKQKLKTHDAELVEPPGELERPTSGVSGLRVVCSVTDSTESLRTQTAEEDGAVRDSEDARGSSLGEVKVSLKEKWKH